MPRVPASSSSSCSERPMPIERCMNLSLPATERQWSKKAWPHRTLDLSLVRSPLGLQPTRTSRGSCCSAQSADWQLVVLSPFYATASTGGFVRPQRSRGQLVSQYSDYCQKCPGGAEYNRRTIPLTILIPGSALPSPAFIQSCVLPNPPTA